MTKLKKLFLALAFAAITTLLPGQNIFAQDTPSDIEEIIAQFTEAGFGDCLADAPEFATVEDVFNYVLTVCTFIYPDDTLLPPWGPGDPAGCPDCPFPWPTDSIYPPIGGGEPTVEEIIAQFTEAGFGDCLADAPEFATVEDVFNYVFTVCTVIYPGDTIILPPWGPGDPAGCPDCPFPWPTDSIYPPIGGGEPTVEEIIAQFTEAGFGDCLADAPEFATVEDVFNYVLTVCTFVYPDDTLLPPWGPGDPAGCPDCPFPWPTDSIYPPIGGEPTVEEIIAQFTEAGFGDCLALGGEFATVDDVLNYIFTNCFPGMPGDTLILPPWGPGDPAGCPDCPFPWPTDSIYPPIGGGPSDAPSVEEIISSLIDAGYGDCLASAPDFATVEEVYEYLIDNCDSFTGGVAVPSCLDGLFTNADAVPTFQQYINYLAANCDAAYLEGIPPCFLEAPAFDTDEAFFAWVAANCEGFDGGIIEGMSTYNDGDMTPMTNYYAAMAQNNSAQNSTTSINNTASGTQISVYPNPASSEISVQTTGSALVSLQVYDSLGRLVMAFNNLNTYTLALNLKQQASGIYFLHTQTADGKSGVQRLLLVK